MSEDEEDGVDNESCVGVGSDETEAIEDGEHDAVQTELDASTNEKRLQVLARVDGPEKGIDERAADECECAFLQRGKDPLREIHLTRGREFSRLSAYEEEDSMEGFLPAPPKNPGLDYDALIIQKEKLAVVIPLLTGETARLLSETPNKEFKRHIYTEILAQALHRRGCVWVDLYQFAATELDAVFRELAQRGFHVELAPSGKHALIKWTQRKSKTLLFFLGDALNRD